MKVPVSPRLDTPNSSVTLEDIKRLATGLNQNFAFPEGWEKQYEKLSKKGNFLAQLARVLEAEKNRSFFESGHFQMTLDEKHDTSHQWGRLIAELLGAVFPQPVPLKGDSPLFGEFSDADVVKARKEIDEKGYYKWPVLLSERSQQELINSLNTKTFQNRETGRVLTGLQARQGIGKLNGVWWLQDQIQLTSEDEFQRLAIDPLILAVAQESMQCAPIHVQTNSWWTFPARKKKSKFSRSEASRNAQMFHQDQEFISFIKVFIYLTDVTEKSGPHVYVEGSANDYEQRFPLSNRFERSEDEDIVRAFGPDRVKSITGQKGQVTFVNTRGYHKGGTMIEGHRLLLQLEYASSLYFNCVQPHDASKLHGACLSLHQNHPRIFLNYRDPGDMTYEAASFRQKIKEKLVHLRGLIREIG